LAADLLIDRGGSLADVGELRARYVAALRAADNHDIAPLLEFARTRLSENGFSANRAAEPKMKPSGALN
jgi:hypothetical protein